MTVSAIIADFSYAAELLGSIAERENDQAAARVGWVLRRLAAGERLEPASGLPTDWPWRLQIERRDLTLQELARVRADLDVTNLSKWIRSELRRTATSGATRRDGALGYVDDLVGISGLGDRNLRELLRGIRDRGKREACDCHGKLGVSAHPSGVAPK